MSQLDPYGTRANMPRIAPRVERLEAPSPWQKIKDAVGRCLPKPLPELPPQLTIRFPETAAGHLQAVTTALNRFVTRLHDKQVVLDSEHWRELWTINPRKTDAYDLEVMMLCASVRLARDVTATLNTITSRGRLMDQERQAIRRVYGLMLHPTIPVSVSTQQQAIRQAQKRRVVMHQDKWRHALTPDGEKVARRYWDLTEAFINLFKHPVLGPAIFGEPTASNEFQGPPPPPELLLEDGHSDERRALRMALRAKEYIAAGRGSGGKKPAIGTGWLAVAVGGLAYLAAALRDATMYVGCLLAFGFNYILGQS